MSSNNYPNHSNTSQEAPPGGASQSDGSINFNNKAENMIKFNVPKNQSSIIKVIGVGGGGSNAVNHMYTQGIRDVDFIVCNTDSQALDTSPVPTKIQLGSNLTEGRGAGSLPEVGKNAAIENLDELKQILDKQTKMLFITAGMGGGTGTGAAPVIAALSKELGILTVGIVTIPFAFEGRKRRLQAEEGIKELRKHVDSLLIICNDKLRHLYGNLGISKAFFEADSVLTTAAKGIAEIITVPGYINVDFEDVRTVMKDSGVAIMGSGCAEGEDRARVAIEQALSSPLLNDNNIKGASNILLYIASGEKEVLMDEISDITDYIQDAAGATAEVIWGNGTDMSLGDKISITLISTGFESSNGVDYTPMEKEIVKQKVMPLVLKEDVKEAPQTFTPENRSYPEEEMKIINKVADTQPEPTYSTPKENAPVERIIKEETVEGFVVYIDQAKAEEPTAQKQHEPVVQEPKVAAQSEMFSDATAQTPVNTIKHEEIPIEDYSQIDKIQKKRQDHLKELSIKLKSPNALAELEKVPAYVRKDEALPDVPHSSESQVSKYTLSMNDENGKPQLSANNSFLHEKPD